MLRLVLFSSSSFLISCTFCVPLIQIDNYVKDIKSTGVIVEGRSSVQEESSGHVGDLQPLYGFKLYTNMGSLTLVLFLTALDILIMSTSIEVISEQFNDYSKSGWIVPGYGLSGALLTLL